MRAAAKGSWYGKQGTKPNSRAQQRLHKIGNSTVVAVLLISLIGCGGAWFIGAQTNLGVSNGVSTSGTISIVQVTVISGNVNVTIVTLLANNTAQSFTFCGNQVSLFPVNTFVFVNFTPAQPCVSTFVVKLN